jgi:hypothetical protein
MTAVLPLPSAALAMIAQRKPMQDKGFEELQRSLPDPLWKVPILTSAEPCLPRDIDFCRHRALVFANAARRKSRS